MAKGFRETILGLFEPQVAVTLIEFGNSLPKIDADILVFMARKSLCLYDVLQRIGVPPARQCVVSDRILEMSLTPLSGKRIALIDDTLILGYSLADTKLRLETEASASVSVHVFAADSEVRCKDLLQPDKIFLQLNHPQLMTLCTAVVRALALAPRPYFVDFPLSRPIRLSPEELPCMLSSVEWTSHRISTKLQERHGVGVFTFFPADDILDELKVGLGRALFSCLDIVKVRVFTRREEGYHRVQVVPLVTLKTMTEEAVNALLRSVLERISTPSSSVEILKAAESPRAQQRLAQYFLSAAVGQRFAQTLSASVGSHVSIAYDDQETDRHYGPWLHQEMAEAAANAFFGLWVPSGRRLRIAPAELPPGVKKWAEESLGAGSRGKVVPGRQPGRAAQAHAPNPFAEFAELFLGLYDTREQKARDEVHSLGRRVLVVPPEEREHTERLKDGLPWSLIVDHLCSRHGLRRPTREVVNLFSLVLDQCNDLGIAVPITCPRDGCVFRAYRHGEDVRFSDGEVALARQAVSGFLAATKRGDIPKLVLEKLLVLLMRIGASEGFLDPIYGTNGSEGTVRIEFHRKGALMMLTQQTGDDAESTWLSEYLVRRGILKEGDGNNYVLGCDVEGNHLTASAPKDAYTLGLILGLLRGHNGQKPPLDDTALTILATCWPPRSAAGALRAQLRVLRSWYAGSKSELRELQWGDINSVSNALRRLRRSTGHESIHAAKFKFVGYRSMEHQRIIRDCTRVLESDENLVAASNWQGYWASISTLQPEQEQKTFDPLINEAATLCWEIATCLWAMEVALRARVVALSGRGQRALTKTFDALRQYDAEMAEFLPRPGLATDLVRLLSTSGDSPTGFDHPGLFNRAVDSIGTRVGHLLRVSDSLTKAIEGFGRLPAHEYRYMLCFSITSGTQSAGGGPEDYRRSVKGFRQFVNAGLKRLQGQAKAAGCEVFCPNDADWSSTKKHVYFGGDNDLHFVRETVRMLVHGADAWPAVRIRMYALPSSIGEAALYRWETDTTVGGEAFSEYWRGLLRASSAFERDFSDGRLLLLLATRELIRSFDMPPETKWLDFKDAALAVEMGVTPRTIDVRCGTVCRTDALGVN